MADSQQQFIQHNPPRLPFTYCTIRALEMDLGWDRNTLIVSEFTKHASGFQENNPQGGGLSSYIAQSLTP